MAEAYSDRIYQVENKLDNINEYLQILKVETAKLEQSLEYIKRDIDNNKSEFWEIKKYQSSISQHDKDLAVLTEKIKNAESLMMSYKKEIEAKMVTKKELENKQHKSWELWISIMALVVSVVVPLILHKIKGY
ncbi:MAG: hypothetical protein ACTTH5_05305 [Wolinella sp.]